MSILISNTELTKTLQGLLPASTHINIISAFLSMPAINWLNEYKSPNSNICIVGRFSLRDFIENASDINAISECIKRGYTVKALQNLHAKIYQIDTDNIYTGSANMTGRGLALVDNINLEACTKVPATSTSLTFINNIIENSTTLTAEIVLQMKNIIDDIVKNEIYDGEVEWPEGLIPEHNGLFVSDFPLVKPGEESKEYRLNPTLEFAKIEREASNFDIAKSIFKRTKAYKWIHTIVMQNTDERDLGFGKVSSLLHDALCDDPAPYRSEIKDIQANLYSYIEIYAKDELEIYVPGKRSQVIRLVKP